MSRPPSLFKKSRLTLEFSEQVRAQLTKLREKTHAGSITEVIRRALGVYETFLGISDHAELYIKNPDGTMEKILLPKP